MKYFFIDTNLFLQCRELSDLPWADIANNSHVSIIIPRAVQLEIDKFKADGNNRRSKRARNTNTFFRNILLSENEHLLVRDHPQPSITVTFSPTNLPEICDRDLPIQLDNTRPDDSILLEIISYRSEYPDRDVVLLTHDTNPMLTAKRLNIAFQAIPDDWLLPPEPDQREKELRALKARIEELEKSGPQIEISLLGDEGSHPKINATITRFSPLSSDEVESLITEIKCAYPMRQSFDSTEKRAVTPNALEENLLGITRKYIPPSDEEIANYQNYAYPNWINSAHEKLTELSSYLSKPHNKIKVALTILNNGNVPAEHTIVRIEVSEGFAILPPADEEGDASKERWMLPNPPAAPNGRYEKSSLFTLNQMLGGVNAFPIPHKHLSAMPPSIYKKDRNLFYYKPRRPSRPEAFWEFECEEFRHKNAPEEFQFEFAVVRDKESINGKLKCSVMAKNLPIPAIIEIPLILSYSEGDTMEEARKLCLPSS